MADDFSRDIPVILECRGQREEESNQCLQAMRNFKELVRTMSQFSPLRNFKELVRTMYQFSPLHYFAPQRPGGWPRDDRVNWIIVKPIQGAFAVNLGDLMHFLSNVKFKSVDHQNHLRRNVVRESDGSTVFSRPLRCPMPCICTDASAEECSIDEVGEVGLQSRIYYACFVCLLSQLLFLGTQLSHPLSAMKDVIALTLSS
ncbi:hypothetical protein SUGI_1173110 [Cryptomeria japonica]|nr:hypothetical protein SUGI_1173110 [Cryptomeria japonica]